jgi:hypothetical protein
MFMFPMEHGPGESVGVRRHTGQALKGGNAGRYAEASQMSAKAKFIEPMLLLRTEKLPEGDAWAYELFLRNHGKWAWDDAIVSGIFVASSHNRR